MSDPELEALIAHEIQHLYQDITLNPFTRRKLEFQADQAALEYSSPDIVISMFKKLDHLSNLYRNHWHVSDSLPLTGLLQANPDCIYEPKQSFLQKLIDSHPPMDKRLAKILNSKEQSSNSSETQMRDR